MDLRLDKSTSTANKSMTSPKKSTISNVERTPISARTKALASKQPRLFLFKWKNKPSVATRTSVSTIKKSPSEPTENVVNSMTFLGNSSSATIGILALSAQPTSTKEERKHVDVSRVLNTILESSVVNVSENLPDQNVQLVVVSERCSKHRVDKRVPLDGTKAPSSKKSKKSHDTIEPLVHCGGGKYIIQNLMPLVSLSIFCNKIYFIYDLTLFVF